MVHPLLRWLGERPDEARIAREAEEHVVGEVLEAARRRGPSVRDVVGESLYHEELRLARADDGPRATSDRKSLAELRAVLAKTAGDGDDALVRPVVRRYTDEIQGHFDQGIYEVVTTALPVGLAALLHRVDEDVAFTPDHAVEILDRHVLVEGHTDELRRLARLGTVLFVPTHSSNLDSVVIGHALFRLGLPPFVYGAGLNLFTNRILGFFMRHLGAYTVDRTKTDPLYKSVLKEYATVALEHGHHGLFFPGGTRSRSGAIERRLKLGLLGTGVTALGRMAAKGRPGARVFVVPCAVSYPLVLEAASLVEGYLRTEGRERFVVDHDGDEFGVVHRWIDFIRGLAALDQRIHVRIGEPMDPVGNPVAPDGESLDPTGRRVVVARYLWIDGAPAPDAARDAAYTLELGARVAAAFRRHSVALPTNVLAFVVFEALRARRRERDPLHLLRALGPDEEIPLAEVRGALVRLMTEIEERDRRGEIVASTTTREHDVDGLLRHALDAFRTYHTSHVLEERGVALRVRDPALVFYYRNRLDGYGLGGAPSLFEPPRGGV